MNPKTGSLTKMDIKSVSGSPACLALDPTKNYMYVAQRSSKTISTYSVDHQSGLLKFMNTISAVDNPVYIATDKSGRYLISAYYSASKAAIYPINTKGQLEGTVIQIINTGKNPHAILTDLSNRYLFIPNTGADKILQFQFNAENGKINPNNPAEVITTTGSGPRHFDFHKTKSIVYFVNEKNSSVTAYNLNDSTGVLSHFQTISTLPVSFTGQNKCADIHLTPDDRFLYASNRGHESIAAFKIDTESGKLTSIGQYATEKTPREFDIDPTGHFLYAAGQNTDKLASYRINQITGELEAIEVIYVGDNPSWVLAVDFLDSTSTKTESHSNNNPGKIILKASYPNPFNSATTIDYFLNNHGRVKVDILNSLGNIVNSLINEKKVYGYHTLKWNGKNDKGENVPSGIYYCRFRTDSNIQINKIILLR
jgi:6-phosphogluconolactonase